MKTSKIKCLAALTIGLLLTSCADFKTFTIDNKTVVVEPYGWFDTSAKNDSVQYKVSTGNIIWSVILCETIVAPILLTGNSLYEPVAKK
jgi:hypothetical protein